MKTRYSFRRRIRNFLSVHPFPYCLLARMGKNGFRVVTNDTDLVIEGYPRSANSFVEAAFLVSQPSGLVLAHHTHAAANVLQAVKLGKPCYVLLRNPADSCISLVIRNRGTHDLALALAEYERFHRAILPVARQICLVPFEVATGDFNRSVTHLNACYNTDFGMLPPGLSKQEIMAKLDEVSRSRGTAPTGSVPYSPFASEEIRELRRKEKEELHAQLQAPALQKRLDRCDRLYDRLMKGTPLAQSAQSATV